MNGLSLIALAALAVPLAAVAQEKAGPQVNPDALILQDFSRRVAAYVDLHNKVRSKVHALKPTSSPDAIAHYEHRLAHEIREARRGTTEGAIFTPDTVREFARLVRIATEGSGSARVQQSLNHAEPVRLPPLQVNSPYPESLPLQTTPPSLLQNLPVLPAEVEYRVVGHDMVLRDVDSNLIVDIARKVIP